MTEVKLEKQLIRYVCVHCFSHPSSSSYVFWLFFKLFHNRICTHGEWGPPWACGPSCVRKQAEQPRGPTVSSVPLCFCCSSCPDPLRHELLPSSIRIINPFLFQLAYGHGFYHYNRKQTRIRVRGLAKDSAAEVGS